MTLPPGLGTMRLGARRTILRSDSLAYRLYGENTDIDERHRHRYEVEASRVPALEAVGCKYVGRNSDETGERSPGR
jgi:CTP synthase